MRDWLFMCIVYVYDIYNLRVKANVVLCVKCVK